MQIMLPNITKNIGRIYIVLYYLKRLEIGETVNKYVQDGGDINIGTVVEILVLNRLCGFATPLYAIAEWAERHAIDEIYGIEAKKLTDDRIGDVLDKIFPYLDTLDSQVTVDMVKIFDIEVKQIHFDPSSFAVVGEHEARAGDPKSIHATYGRDGKGRINRRQVRFGIAMSADGNIPLLGKAYSGNASDHEMHPEFLEMLREIADSSDFLFVADSKFDSRENLLNIFTHRGTFLCPGVLRDSVKDLFFFLLERNDIKWQEIDYATKADRKKAKNKRPVYKACEILDFLADKQDDGAYKLYFYRIIFVYSSEKAKVQKRTRDKKIRKIESTLRQIGRRLNKWNYTTKEYIEKKIAEALSLNEMGKLFSYRISKRHGLFRLEYSIDEEQVRKLGRLDGVYILKTNLPEDTHPTDELFHIYKQQGQIEHKIKVVKGPLGVAPIYLQDPKRISSLFFVIVQALKVYSVMEREIRKGIEDYGKPIPVLPEGRKTATPSGETILRAFDDSVYLLVYCDSDGKKIRKLTKPNSTQELIFRILYMQPPDLRSLTRKIEKFRKRGEP